MIDIQVDEGFGFPIEMELLEKAVCETLAEVGQANVGMAIVMTGDEQLQRLNKQYLGIDAPTDVLSFPADYQDPDSGERYLGDILISIPRAQAQAQANAQPVSAEILLLAVHGVLHLLGYDHADETETNIMWTLQARILARL